MAGSVHLDEHDDAAVGARRPRGDGEVGVGRTRRVGRRYGTSIDRASVVAASIGGLNATPLIAFGPTPPPIGTFWSAEPWMWMADTGRLGVQSLTSIAEDCTPIATI